MREQYLVGNWKMNQTIAGIDQFFHDLDKNLDSFIPCHLWLAPQAIHLFKVLEYAERYGLDVGIQNCSEHVQGAYTGEVSPAALADMGASFALVGHSERRQYYGETGDVLRDKVLMTVKSGLTAIYCVGENLSQREQGTTEDVVRGQLVEGLSKFPREEQERLMVAYEPVWAIGTGKSASPEQAQEVHRLIRKTLSSLGLGGKGIVLLYGGSVKPENIAAILSQKDIDGALVGGASLDGKSFARMAGAFPPR